MKFMPFSQHEKPEKFSNFNLLALVYGVPVCKREQYDLSLKDELSTSKLKKRN